jgi:hypothetical protein
MQLTEDKSVLSLNTIFLLVLSLNKLKLWESILQIVIWQIVWISRFIIELQHLSCKVCAVLIIIMSHELAGHVDGSIEQTFQRTSRACGERLFSLEPQVLLHECSSVGYVCLHAADVQHDARITSWRPCVGGPASSIL